MSKKRIDCGGDGKALTDNPFAKLRPDGLPTLPEKVAPVAAPPKPTVSRPFRITRTRKGGLPLALEKRPGGKVVTVIRNAEGDLDAFLAMLKKKCGAGGAVREGAIEIQGDQVQRITPILTEFLV